MITQRSLAKSLHVLVIFSLLLPWHRPAAQLGALDGEWISEEWGYGFKIEGQVGYATHWMNTYDPRDETSRGDMVLRIGIDGDGSIKGRQLFYDGRWVEISGELIDNNTMSLKGSKSEWIMKRVFESGGLH